MSAELSLSLNFKFVKGTANGIARLERLIFAQNYDVSGTAGIENIISVGTSDETLAKGDIGTIGYCFFHNLDGTNYIEIGSDGSAWPLKLKAGEIAILRWNQTNVHVKANTGACNFEYILLPD